jgi:t-SNARE complex subunit (syntaxin)
VVRNVLAQITERSTALRFIEAGMLELHQIFSDLAMLVEEQGRTLDSIQANVRPRKSWGVAWDLPTALFVCPYVGDDSW